MSFLADGASCAAGANPVSQLASKQGVDRSLQQNHVRASPAGPSSLRGGDLRQLSQQDKQLFQQMQQSDARPDVFRFEEMRKEISPAAPSRWVSEFNGMNSRVQQATPMPMQAQTQQQSLQSISPGWVSEFQSSQMQTAPGPSYEQVGHMPMPHMGSSLYGGYSSSFGMSPAVGFVGPQSHQAATVTPMEKVDVKENSKWEEQFNKIEQEQQAQGPNEQSSTQNATVDSAKQENVSADMQADDLIQDLDNEEAGPEAASFFDNSYPPNWDQIWDQINGNGQADDGSLHTRSDLLDSVSSTGHVYEFAKENEFTNEEDPFALGVYMMDNGAKLSCAVLCFEEAVKRDPQHVEAWVRLGDAQAQNEVEEQAILALEKAVILNPQHESALLSLAISYTNEGYDTVASQILEKWVNARYPEIATSVPPARAGDRDALQSRVTEIFLKAALQGSANGNIDPDIQVGLGVLCYRDDDYSKAVDCFRAALAARPNDASLWNRLGATLANASKPEDAIDAYYKALELRPSFVRARYNLAVSCINIGCYKEAADNLLSAMSLHETEEGTGIDFDRSGNLVETLRRVFFAMDRRDLLVKLKPDMRLDEFRSDFNF